MEFSQVVVWPGRLIGPADVSDFEAWMLEQFNTHVKYIENVVTEPDWADRGTEGAGGRSDALFYVATEDIGKFAISRFSIGARWIEDVLDNEIRMNADEGILEGYSIYPAHIKEYRTW